MQITMNEKIKGINPVPLLSGTYNKDNDGVDLFLVIFLHLQITSMRKLAMLIH